MHPERSNNSRNAYRIALFAVLILLIGSLVCYRQRMLFIDPAWIVYSIINTKSFCIVEHRYGAIATQIVPVIGVYFNWSLRAILVLYSASFYIFYTAVMLIVGRYCRQYAFGTLLALYLVLMVSDNYFWPNNEVHQGVAWAFLALGIFFTNQTRQRPDILGYILFPVLSFLAIFSHFIVIVPFSFLWIYCLLNEKVYRDSRQKIAQIIAGSLCIIILFLIKYELGRNGWYDGGKLNAVKTLNARAVLQSFTNGHSKMISILLLKNYWMLIPIFLAGQIMLLKERKFLQALLTIGYVVGFYSLICMTYPEAFRIELLYYIESEWMAFAIIVATPFVFQVIPAMRGAVAVGVMAFIFLVRLAYIGYSYRDFDSRFAMLDNLTQTLHQSGIRKAVITMENPPRDQVFFMDWGTPVESMMLSDLRGYAQPITFKIVSPDFVLPQHSALLFLNCFGTDTIRKINMQYFPLDTTSPYKTLRWNDLPTSRQVKD